MVHTGPSKGCRTCRTRKVKCDETRPVCQRCIKSKRTCLGYKDEKDFFFRDDTETVERKAIASRVRAAKQASRESSKALVIRQQHDSSSCCSSPESDIDFISSTLPQSPEDNAVCHFMTNYVMRSRHPETSRGFMEHLLPFYLSSSSRSPLSLATTATALYANRDVFPDTVAITAARKRATTNYVEALRLINLAIQDPKEAKSDSLLMAVLLLGLYEVIVANETSTPFLGHHTHGAVALVKFRGQEQFKSDDSVRLFLAVQTQLVQYCIQNSTPGPLAEFMACFTGAPIQNKRLTCANRLVLLTIPIPGLRLREKHLLDCPRYAPAPELVTELMQAAKAVDADLVKWSEAVPEVWHYVSIAVGNGTLMNVYPRSIDIYYDTIVASTWNSWRAYRLYVLTIVMKCASILFTLHGDPDTEREDFEVIDTIQRLVNGICSSVPFHIGHTVNGIDTARSLYPHAVGSRQVPDPVGALGVFMVKWPLSVASTMTCVPESQQRWMREYQVL